MPQEFRHIIPTAPGADIFAIYQLTHEFYRETQDRQEFERYCEWYRLTAKCHQQELQKMKGDINLFGWFCHR
ncbi:MAG TPA: hypothetical protein DDZ80_24115 [Cyanobacteria bacterium UBA8803]|nr:hypothetical protein [Cyanobacteria bacterium UBA9273]HBL61398.1 hypothetical protein [Cyanobacteria bacterium UBA8803]